MVKFKGAGSSVRAPDTSGVQRAHESLMQSNRDNTQAGVQMGNAVNQAVDTVNQQSRFDQDMALRKERLDVEMAKGGLQFTGEGPDRKVVSTPEAQSAAANEAALKERKVSAEEQRAETEFIKTQTYLANAQLATLKAGYTDPATGQLTPEGQSKAQELYKQLGIKKKRSLESRLIQGDESAVREAQALIGKTPDQGDEGTQQMKQGLGDFQQPMGMSERLVKSVRARIDYDILQGIHASGGVMPDHDDIGMESAAMRAFSDWRNIYVDAARSGLLPTPPARSQQEKNRFFNKIAAKAVLSGIPAPGSMAGPSMTEGIPAAQAPTGNPDDGSQQSPSGPPGLNPNAGPVAPGAFTPDAGGAGQSWNSVQ